MTKLYQVVNNDDFYTIYLTTLDEKLAKKTLKEIKKSGQKYARYELVITEINNDPPLLTWLFFVDECGVDVCVEEPGSNYDVSWSDVDCYKVEATTLKEAKKILKKTQKEKQKV